VRGEHSPDTVRGLYVEGTAPSPVDELIALASFHERLVEGLEGEQHPQPSLGVDMKDQQKPVVLGPDIHLGIVPRGVVPTFVETNLDSLILALDSPGVSGDGTGSDQQQ
jgi:hypothetical protein